MADLYNPENIKHAIADKKISNSTKQRLMNTYAQFLKYAKIDFTKPKYNKQESIPFIPTEEEINTIIAACGAKLSVFLTFLKATGARSGEAINTQWTDIDFERKTVIIHPEKRSNARILPLTEELARTLGTLNKRKDGFIFARRLNGIRAYYDIKRKETAEKLNNPRLIKIGFHTFRHWKGTTEYHKTKDIMHVKYVLGHKAIESTMIYINIENALWTMQPDEWTSIVTHSTEEEQNAINTNFELVRAINETTAIYRKRK